MQQHGLNSYQTAARASLRGRDLEAAVLARCNRELEAGIAGDAAMLDSGIERTRMFWSIVQASLIEPENTMSDTLKANLMSLSIFIDRQTEISLRAGKESAVRAVINIHKQIIAGLGEGGVASAPADAAFRLENSGA